MTVLRVYLLLGMKTRIREHIALNGSEAIAYGAIKAGVSFSATYPMTPATPIFDTLVKYAQEYTIAAKQAEDEISAVCMTIGASYAGVRSMTMTSGGGFSLMVEALGFTGIAEIPLVLVEAMRGGPSTGLPTKTEQSDLRFIVHASQGEFPRVVLAPGDVEESFFETQRAFNLADMYQLPVIIPTARSIISPFRAKALNSSKQVNPFAEIAVGFMFFRETEAIFFWNFSWP